MTRTTELIDQAKAASTSDEFTAVIASIDEALADIDNRQAALAGEREAAVFDGGSLPKLRKTSADLDDDRETLRATRAGAERRRAEVLRVEQKAASEVLGERAKAKAAELKAATEVYHAAILEARASFIQMNALIGELDRMNEALSVAGRSDLMKNARTVTNAVLVPPSAGSLTLRAAAGQVERMLSTLASPRVLMPQNLMGNGINPVPDVFDKSPHPVGGLARAPSDSWQ